MPAPGATSGRSTSGRSTSGRSTSEPGTTRRALRLPGLPTRVLIPAVLLLVLVVAVVAGAAVARRTASSAQAVGDTGPVLAGVELPADGQAGPPGVTLSPAAAAHPRAAEIGALVQRSVDARNARDYGAWLRTATAASASSTGPAAFAAQTRTTRLGSVALRRIDPVGTGEYVVPLDLVTTQDPADAPPDVRVPRLCWQISAVVTTERGALRMSDNLPGSSLRTPC